MQVVFESRDPESADMKPLVQQRVRFALRRLGWLAPRVKVQLSDVNGPRGGIDKRCQIELTTPGKRQVVVTSIAGDWLSALQGALARATKNLVQDLQRNRSRQLAGRPIKQSAAF